MRAGQEERAFSRSVCEKDLREKEKTILRNTKASCKAREAAIVAKLSCQLNLPSSFLPEQLSYQLSSWLWPSNNLSYQPMAKQLSYQLSYQPMAKQLSYQASISYDISYPMAKQLSYEQPFFRGQRVETGASSTS